MGAIKSQIRPIKNYCHRTCFQRKCPKPNAPRRIRSKPMSMTNINAARKRVEVVESFRLMLPKNSGGRRLSEATRYSSAKLPFNYASEPNRPKTAEIEDPPVLQL